MDANLLRTINKLWKDRHNHDGEDFQEQITIIRQTVESQGDQVAGSATGAHVHLRRSAVQEIAAGGELVEWDAAVAMFPQFEFAVTVPVTQIEVLKPGYYNVRVELLWSSWSGGGSVQIIRTRGDDTTTVWSPSMSFNWESVASQAFSDTAEAIPFQQGDLIEVVVDHGDASPQDLARGLLVVDLVDRYTVEPESEPDEQLFIFTEDGTFDWSDAGSPATVDVWIIAGGGGGGGSSVASFRGGGGGAGGVEILTDYAVSGDCAVVVGLGGAGASGGVTDGDNGEDSSFDGETATGGGGGGSEGTSGANGGSGGGESGTSGAPGTGVAGQGSDGGSGAHSGGTRTAGGGGGYGAVGANGNAGTGKSGDGGIGIDLTALVGTEYGEAGWFAGGGGGGNLGANAGLGGTGGGGSGGNNGSDGAVNTGGGGGGAQTSGNAGDGGSGIVIVRVGG